MTARDTACNERCRRQVWPGKAQLEFPNSGRIPILRYFHTLRRGMGSYALLPYKGNRLHTFWQWPREDSALWDDSYSGVAKSLRITTLRASSMALSIHREFTRPSV